MNRLVFSTDLFMNSVRWNTGVSFLSIAGIEELNDLKTTMNVRLPGSPVEYALHINYKLDVYNGTKV